jgi:hypothetical protein
MTGYLFGVIGFFCTFLANYCIERYGLKFSISLASVMITLSTGLRLLINYSFTFVLIGQILTAMFGPLVMNSITKYTAAWYKPENVIFSYLTI